MKLAIGSIFIGLLALSKTLDASAQISINLGINPCGYSLVYGACPYYGPPVGVYLGGGHWGDERGRHDGRRGGPAHGGGRRR